MIYKLYRAYLGGEIIEFDLKKIVMLMLILTVLSISLGCVSASHGNDTDSNIIDDNSQLREFDENSVGDNFNINENDVLNSGITPEVKISDNIDAEETKNVSKGTSVTINVQATANFNYHYDYKVATLYVNGNSIKSENLLPYNYDDNDRRGSFDYTFVNDGTYEVKVVLAAYQGYSVSYEEATSNIITYIVGNASSEIENNNNSEITNGTNTEPQTNLSAKITVWDMNYPDNITIYFTGDYVSNIAYNIVKSGDGFSDENLEVYINGQSIGRTTPNSSNRLGSLTFDEDNEWSFYIIYSASVNDKTITVMSNVLTFITKNTTNGVNNNTGNEENKSDDSGNVTNNTDVDSNKTDDSGNSTDVNSNKTDENVNNGTDGIEILIRDSSYPNNSTITLNDKYNVLQEYYVTVPGGDLLVNEIVLMCNDEAVTTITTPTDSTYTSFGGRVFLNETGTYKFSAKYYYYEFMGTNVQGNVVSNTITYVVSISNTTSGNNTVPSDDNGTVPSGDEGNSSGVDVNGTVPSGDNGTVPSGNNTNTSGNTSDNIGFSIDSSDLIRAYNSPFDYKATFYDKNGNLLKNTEVLFVINGNDYNVVTDEYGVAKITNALGVGSFEVTIFNPATSDSIKRNITIVDRITGLEPVTVDYSYSAKYQVRLFADNGNPVGAGESVVITINNVEYPVTTDSNGYAILTVKNKGLIPKTYAVTAVYKGVTLSSSLVVKQILKSKNVKVKKSAKTKKFSATLKTSAGKAIKNKKIKFKIKGKTYKAKTNSKGVATIKITNLKKVGKYTVTIKYLKLSIKKNIKIKK